MNQIKGTCYCGSVEYLVDDQFEYAMNCHCSNCRKMTGSAFKPFAGIKTNLLQLTKGKEHLKIQGDEKLHNAFCNNCGSLLYSKVREGHYLHVTMGTLIDAPSIKPSAHIFVGSKASWYKITDELPQFNEFPES